MTYLERKEKLLKKAGNSAFDDNEVILSNKLSRQNSKFTLEEEQLLFCILSQLDQHSINESKVHLNKAELIKKLGLEKTNDKYAVLASRFQSMMDKTYVSLRIPGLGNWNGYIISGWGSKDYSDHYTVDLYDRFMPYIEQLAGHYTAMKLDSIIQFDSKYSLDLYKYLSSWQKGTKENDDYHQMRYMSTKELKELFGLGKDAYVRKTGKFDRYTFEQRTVEVAVREINEKVPSIRVGWDKIKQGNRIKSYWFEIIDLEKADRITKEKTDYSSDKFKDVNGEPFDQIKIEIDE